MAAKPTKSLQIIKTFHVTMLPCYKAFSDSGSHEHEHDENCENVYFINEDSYDIRYNTECLVFLMPKNVTIEVLCEV